MRFSLEKMEEPKETGYSGPDDIKRLKEEVSELSLVSSEEDVRWYKRGRIDEIKEKSIEQTLHIAELLEQLQEKIKENPDITEQELDLLAIEAAKKYSLSFEQELEIKSGIELFVERHTIIKKYRQECPDDIDLFEKCFGFRPKGEVRVHTGPMSFYIQCLDDEDYANAYAHNATASDKLHEKLRDRALKSGGAAFHVMPDETLNNMVAIERTSTYMRDVQKVDRVEKTETQQTFILPKNIPGIFFGVQGVAEWGAFSHAYGNEKAVSISQVGATIPPVRISLEDGQPKHSFVLEKDGQRVGYATVENGVVEITNTTDKAFYVHYYTSETLKEIDEEASTRTRDHEEQHLLNSMFMPDNYAGKIPSREALPEILYAYRFIKDLRKACVDNNARDEILAHYSGSATLQVTETHLLRSELYDYKKKFQSTIDGFIKENARFQKLNTTAQEMVLKKVFVTEYEKDLKRWLRAIGTLEKKKYSRKEILSLLYQEPLEGWIRLSRRLPISTSAK